MRIKYDGYINKRSGRLDQGDQTQPGWTELCNDGAYSPRTSFTTDPDTYYFEDPWTDPGGHNYGNSDYRMIVMHLGNA
ncbi:MAG: hypothetical protein M5U22_14265 [Thermoleophilia bacterium]|nr:hypothetical protein [Thermoleophilia bacterium]